MCSTQSVCCFAAVVVVAMPHCAEFLAAATKAVSEGPPIDMANAIVQTAGDEEFLKEIVSDLITETLQHYEQIRKAMPARNVQVRIHSPCESR